MIPKDFPEPTQEFIQEVRRAVPDVHFDRLTRLLYSTDASIYQIVPVGVAMPRHADEVAAAIEIAGRHKIPVLPRGGGSSLDGQATGQALILDFTPHMHDMIEVDTEQRTVRTQPGITLGDLNRRLRKHGLMFGPDPASADRCTVGGIVGNNSTGAHSIIYGMTSDHVRALDVVMADARRVHLDALNGDTWENRGQRPGLEGAIYRAVPGILQKYANIIATGYPKTWRTVAGYNLNHVVEGDSVNIAKLVVGSEGTLAAVTEATLNLVPVVPMTRLAMVHFSTMRAALEAVPVLLESGPTAIELIDKMMLDLARDRVEYRRLLTFVQGDPEIVLIVEYSGSSEKELDAGIDRLGEVLKRLRHTEPVVVVADAAGQANVWYVRKVGLGILLSIRGDSKPLPFIEDCAVPVEHLADYVSRVLEIVQEAGLAKVAIYAHASAGCLHLRPLINLKSADGIRQLRQIGEAVVDLVVSMNGTVSGEHGEGLARGEFSERMFGPEMVRAFHEVKAAFDPERLMNPGKVVDAPKMDDQTILRYGTDYAVPYEPAQTVFSFEVDGGFARAVEMCNGAGVCRKVFQGVMCPSYMATRDETHSTRGRANALRAAMMGFLGPEGMTSQELYDVMDLCLTCHGCKAECPSAVDVARLKYEFLHGYYKEHGVPLRTRMFSRIAALNRMGQPVAPLTNAILAGPGKWALTQLGVHPRRELPRLTSETFTAWYRRHRAGQNGGGAAGRREVVFFHDTFMEHNHPAVGQAAVKVLEAAGFAPIILEKRACCGRPAVSKGLLDEAKELAQQNLALLAPYAQRGIPIIGCEPGCMSMLADEYVALVPGEQSKAVAGMTLLLDQLLVQEAREGRLKLTFDGEARRVLFHGHCQQKATFGADSTLAMLRLMPNCTAEMVDSSCCGMAGSFGYEKEHYDLSIKLAEITLAPAVRAAPAGTIICATGTSCRDQIAHTTDRQAIHPIEVIAAALR
jgi:FAD/FMN-containing dehydrogenase/Fe-S oxidoreductase